MSDAQPPQAPTLILTGPTGIGKTELAIALAERHGLEIISADSMQVYRGMEIGTAQPDADQRARAPFHLCGAIEPDEPFNVQRFIQLSAQAHTEIEARGSRPIYVGGTGMYLRALRWGLFDQASNHPAVRAQLESEIALLGAPALYARLLDLDPATAARVAPNDAVRIVRALEVLAVTGRPLSGLQQEWGSPQPRFPHRLVILIAPRAEMIRRIAQRADAMFRTGWIEEVERLLTRGLTPDSHCFKALGYREIASYLRGEMNRETLRERIIHATSQFARRQIIWFRRESPAIWLEAIRLEGSALADLERVLAAPCASPKIFS